MEPTRVKGEHPPVQKDKRSYLKIILVALVVAAVIWAIASRITAESKRDTQEESREPGMEQILPR